MLSNIIFTFVWNLIEFYVDGKNIPEVDFDVGPSWSGLLPISANANETRKVSILSNLLVVNSNLIFSSQY